MASRRGGGVLLPVVLGVVGTVGCAWAAAVLVARGSEAAVVAQIAAGLPLFASLAVGYASMRVRVSEEAVAFRWFPLAAERVVLFEDVQAIDVPELIGVLWPGAYNVRLQTRYGPRTVPAGLFANRNRLVAAIVTRARAVNPGLPVDKQLRAIADRTNQT